MAKARRGFRLIQVEIPVREYSALELIGGQNYRSIEQQAAYLIHQAIEVAEGTFEQEALNGQPLMGGTLTVDLPEDENAEVGSATE